MTMKFEGLRFVEQASVPCFYVDNFLSGPMLEDFLSHWPTIEESSPVLETEGSYENNVYTFNSYHGGRFTQKSERKNVFWKKFVEEQCPIIADKIKAEFYHFLVKKYDPQDLEQGEIQTLSLRRIQGHEYQGMARHVHYYHDPLWLFTYFIYLEDDPNGLTLYKYDLDNEETLADAVEHNIKIASPSYKGDRKEALVENVTLEFKKNRFLVVMDSSISWHGVKSPAPTFPTPSGSRKHMIVHYSLPRSLIMKYYGFDESEWPVKHVDESNEQLTEMIARDVRQAYYPLHRVQKSHSFK